MFVNFIHPFGTYANMRIFSAFMFIKLFSEDTMSQSDVQKTTFVNIGFSLVFIGYYRAKDAEF
jgi:hypothetical protein